MPRNLLIAVLMALLLMPGCSARQPEPSPAARELGVSKSFFHFDDAEDNHPLARGALYTTYIVLIGVALVAIGLVVVAAHVYARS